jgi:hypothetical protein
MIHCPPPDFGVDWRDSATGNGFLRYVTWRAARCEAGDRARTGDIQLGRLALYQLSYTRARLA